MHEMSLMGGVFEAIEQTLSLHPINRVLQVKLRVGKLTNADPEALLMAFAAYSKDTKCEGAELIVESVPVRGRCKTCEEEFAVVTSLFLCSKCHSGIEVIQGEELLLESLEVE